MNPHFLSNDLTLICEFLQAQVGARFLEGVGKHSRPFTQMMEGSTNTNFSTEDAANDFIDLRFTLKLQKRPWVLRAMALLASLLAAPRYQLLPIHMYPMSPRKSPCVSEPANWDRLTLMGLTNHWLRLRPASILTMRPATPEVRKRKANHWRPGKHPC